MHILAAVATKRARVERAIVGAALAGLVVFSDPVANATVTQVDGGIVPTKINDPGGLQTFFNANDNGMQAVRDASEEPQVFLPRTNLPVIFADRIEDAGFENTFGWYNVGDDVTTAAGRAVNLHPVLGCGTPMLLTPTNTARQHTGNPDFYEQDAEPGDSKGVDFAAERTAGRYKGGFIGLYLITPEGNGRDNQGCGDSKQDSAGRNQFGHIYFTQKDLNDDGDYVHDLVYTSRADPEIFYFGFEDQFRGNDDDFNDMFISITGLRPPCVPSSEICDNRDNDCDGLVDAADPDLTGIHDPCTCDNSQMICRDGDIHGACQGGQTVCVAGALQCTSITGPTSELCNGVDDDCNGELDNDPAGTGAACDGPDADLCLEGTEVCRNAQIVCSDDSPSNDEICNDIDDDCDTTTDENPIDEGGSCGTDAGECAPGHLVCVLGGHLECTGGVGPSDEICNGLDDDCDGNPDDNVPHVNEDCGVTNEGECRLGKTACVAGAMECVDEAGPTVETCNHLDDDCDGTPDDNPVDVGQPCGTDTGECVAGHIACVDGTPRCVDEVGPSAELCNRLDDDCDGVVDDDPARVGEVCGDTAGACEPGALRCIAGELVCVGGFNGSDETCNGIDDDCDDKIDEGPLCGAGVCDHGTCSPPCAAGEFPCPIGQVCRNNFCIPDPCTDVVCSPGPNGEQNVCVEGVCVDVCETVTCTGERVCRRTDGRCVPNNCDFLPDLCTDTQLCVDAECIEDKCHDVTCPTGQFCRAGSCVGSCAGVDCPDGQLCRDGSCQPTGCPTDCTGRVCNPTTMTCVDDPCLGKTCSAGDVCDPSTGACIDDPCIGVRCPDQQMCVLGQCYTRSLEPDAGPPAPDAAPRDLVAPGGGGGCDSGGGAAPLLPVLALAALWAARRRAALAAAALALVVQAGCAVNDYCVNCAVDGDGGMTADAAMADAPMFDARVDAAPPGCDSGVTAPEECNGLDDDCDGTTDEGFDLAKDPLNCGECGHSCALGGTLTHCVERQCETIGCAPGNHDIDGDPANGCEYACFTSNGGDESPPSRVCDRLDNDCDKKVDENITFETDHDNCGECGRVCNFFGANGHCSSSQCGFDPAVDCLDGFLDLDHAQPNGCEYRCSPTNGGTEICDGIDNNCEGHADETFDKTTDPNNCGACGRVCTFPRATAHCAASACVFDPAADCQPGFVDLNGRQVDGCEYQCTRTGFELCDGVDNDCDGFIDDSPMGAGDACSNGPNGVPTGACTATGHFVCAQGRLVCRGAPSPTVETCNNIDDDCDGIRDEDAGGNAITRTCFSGDAAQANVGLCRSGTQTCTNGAFPDVCAGEVLPTSEECDGVDQDCDARIDEASTNGPPLRQACYTGPTGTRDVGVCHGGTATCAAGRYGACLGQQTPSAIDACGDGLDTDCDNLNDAGELCLGVDAEDLRLDAPGGDAGSAAGEDHSFDLMLAAGGATASSATGSKVYAVWNDLGNGAGDIYFRMSTDGGATWGDIKNLTDGINEAAVEPFIVVGRGGGAGGADRVYVVFQTFTNNVRDIRVVISNDGGAGWGTVSNALDADGDSFHHHAAVSTDGKSLAVVWERLDTGTLARTIRSRISVNTGAFSTERTINVGSGASSRAGRPQVAVTRNGNANRYVWVWREARAGATTDIFSAFSDGTGAPADDRRLDGDTGQSRASDFPQLVGVGANAYVVWQDIATQAGQGSDVVFSRSTNAGGTWSTERIIDDPAGEVSASFTPSLAVAAGAGTSNADRIAIAWEDRRQGSQVFVAVSNNAGAGFGTAVRASSQAGDPVTGQTTSPQLAFATGANLVVAYVNNRASGALHVYAASSIDAGVTWGVNDTQMDTGSGAALAPSVAKASGSGLPGAVIVGWTDFRTNGTNGDPYSRRSGR